MHALLRQLPALVAVLLCLPAISAARQISTFSLAAAIRQAQASSPRREGTAAVARSTLDALAVAGRLPNPIFELRTENWSRSQSLPLDVFAVATQYVELGDKRALRRDLAAADHDVAVASLALHERTIALETAQAYISALRARALVETLTAHRDGLAALVAGTSLRVEEGYSPEADLLKFRTEAARNDGEIARARLELERSLAALSIVVGSDAPIAAGALAEPAPLAVPAADAPAIAAAVARHPAVIAAEAARTRSLQLTAAERARRIPDVAVSAGYKRTGGIDTLVAGVALSLPVFDRNAAAVARAAGAERASSADRDAVIRQLSADSASLIRAATDISAQAATAAVELLRPAEEVRNAALAAFREGGTDVLKVIDAERVYTDVRRAAAGLRLDALLTTIEARFALGEEAIP
jgi:cobalt-zinc-cadmium efflux system outer membrane protein